MKISESMKKYLNGECFSNSGVFNYNHKQERKTRLHRLIQILSEHPEVNVVHLGCCDHIGLIDEKINNGTYLHSILMNTVKNVMGIDINEEAVRYLGEKGIPQIIYADIFKDKEKVYEKLKVFNQNKKWDYILAGEVIEHVDNPVSFLSELNNAYFEYIDKIIITVPNAFYIKTIIEAMKGKEAVNTDHRYWFTPYTICKVLTSANIEIEELYFTDFINQKKFKILNPILAKPIMCGSLIAIGKLRGGGMSKCLEN